MLIHASLDLSLPDCMLLHLFYSGLDKDVAPCLDRAAGGTFSYSITAEQREILDHILGKHAFLVMETKTLQAIAMSSVGETPLVESHHVPSLGSTNDPLPEPRAPKEAVLSNHSRDQAATR